MRRLPKPEKGSLDRRPRAPALPLLVETRFSPPNPGPATLDRPRVLSLLDQYAERRVTLIAAPTGFGKTTALVLWLRTRGHVYGWLSLEAADDDPVRFTTYLVSAIRRGLPRVGAAALTALQNPRVDIATDVVGSIINDIAAGDDRLVLVIDDYHRIRDPECRAIVATLVAELPPQLHLIIATREDPYLPLGRLRATGNLGEIRADDLRFTALEIRSFLRGRSPIELDGSALAALEDRTEGWPAGLNLAVLSISASPDPRAFLRSFTGSHRHVVDYLTSEILDALPAQTREFLLRTSVLERLNGDLCDFVTDMPESETRLAELERSNLFVTGLDEDGRWFRYHRMLRDAMLAELAIEHPRLSPRLLARGAVWHESDGSLDEAVRYAISADDQDLAGTLIARHYLTFTRGGHLSELRDLIDSLDTARLTHTRGSVAFVAAMAGGLAGESADIIEAHVAELERYGIGDGLLDGIRSTEAGVLMTRAAYLYDDVGRQRAAGSKLLARWPDDPYPEGIGRVALGYTSYLHNDLRRARDVLKPFGPAVDDDRPLISIVGISIRALAEIEAGHVAVGEEAAHEAYTATVRGGLGDAVASAIAHEALGVAELAADRPGEAIPLIERALSLTKATQALPRAARLLALARAWVAAGDPAVALRSAGEARSLIETSRDPGGLPVRLAAVERLLTGPRRRNQRSSPSVAELRVLRLLPSTLSQREIAQELYLSPETVKTHVRMLYRKLDAGSRGEAIQRAKGAGLLA